MVKVSERNYVIFVLGYDVLQRKLVNENAYGYPMECDTAYDICAKLADQFFKSSEYKDMSISMLQALYDWSDEHTESINEMIDTWEENNG